MKYSFYFKMIECKFKKIKKNPFSNNFSFIFSQCEVLIVRESNVLLYIKYWLRCLRANISNHSEYLQTSNASFSRITNLYMKIDVITSHCTLVITILCCLTFFLFFTRFFDWFIYLLFGYFQFNSTMQEFDIAKEEQI